MSSLISAPEPTVIKRAPVDGARQAVSGRYFPPQSTGFVNATLRRDGQSYRVEPVEGQAITLDAKALRKALANRIGSVPRRVYLDDGGLFETEFDEGFALVTGRSGNGLRDRIERSGWALAIVALLVIALIFGFYRFALPVGAGFAARVTPVAYADVLDAGTLRSLDATAMDPTDVSPERQERLTAQFEALLDALEPEQRAFDFRLLFRDSEFLGPNAVALPGGTVIVTDALVRRFSDDVIVAILGHEIGHVVERHSLTQLYRAAGFAYFVNLVAGDMGEITDQLILEANLLRSLSTTRQFEASADRFAVDLLARAELPAEPLVTFFEEMEALQDQATGSDDPIARWYSTHPGTRDRITAIRARIEAQRASGEEP